MRIVACFLIAGMLLAAHPAPAEVQVDTGVVRLIMQTGGPRPSLRVEASDGSARSDLSPDFLALRDDAKILWKLSSCRLAGQKVTSEGNRQRLTIQWEDPDWKVEMVFEARQGWNAVFGTVRFENRRPTAQILDRVQFIEMKGEPAGEVFKFNGFAIMRAARASFFATALVPQNTIVLEPGPSSGNPSSAGFSINLPEARELKAGASWTSPRFAIGLARREGKVHEPFYGPLGGTKVRIINWWGNVATRPIDLGEATAIRDLVARLVPAPADPFFVTGAYEQDEYVMRKPEAIAPSLELLAGMGINYYWIYEDIGSWEFARDGMTPPKPAPKLLAELKTKADSLGVKLGYWICGNHGAWYPVPHSWPIRSEWCAWPAPGQPVTDIKVTTGTTSQFLEQQLKATTWKPKCFAHEDYAQWLTHIITGVVRNNGAGAFGSDFLGAGPCFSPHHGHSIEAEHCAYRASCNAQRFMAAVKAVSPEMKIFVWQGWNQYAPRFFEAADNYYYNDQTALPIPGLTPMGLFNDYNRRERHDFFYTGFMNPWLEQGQIYNQVIWTQDFEVGRLPIAQEFRYSILQNFASSSNCFLWFYTWIVGPGAKAYRTTAEIASDQQFLREQLAYVKKNHKLFEDLQILAGPPDVGTAEVYARFRDGHGLLHLVNPNYFAVTARVDLGKIKGLPKDKRFALREVQPRTYYLANGSQPWFKAGQTLSLELEPKSVRVIEIVPMERMVLPAVCGAQGTVVKCDSQGWAVKVQGETGERPNLLVVGRQANQRAKALTILPGKEQNSQVRHWKLAGVDLATGLSNHYPQGIKGESVYLPSRRIFSATPSVLCDPPKNLADCFFGVYFANLPARAEQAELSGSWMHKPEEHEPAAETAPQPAQLDLPNRALWAEAEFELAAVGPKTFPFVNLFRPERVKQLRAWIDGREVVVQTGKIPPNVPDYEHVFHALKTATAQLQGAHRIVLFMAQ